MNTKQNNTYWRMGLIVKDKGTVFQCPLFALRCIHIDLQAGDLLLQYFQSVELFKYVCLCIIVLTFNKFWNTGNILFFSN